MTDDQIDVWKRSRDRQTDKKKKKKEKNQVMQYAGKQSCDFHIFMLCRVDKLKAVYKGAYELAYPMS